MSFSLTRKTDYALVALSALAREKRDLGNPLSARTLSENFNLPLSLLMNVLKELHRAELIGSRRGVSGGYYLNLDPTDISIKQVIEAMEGPVNVTLCSEEHEDDCTTACQILSLCPISGPIQKFNDLFKDFLSNISLQTLLENKASINLPIGV